MYKLKKSGNTRPLSPSSGNRKASMIGRFICLSSKEKSIKGKKNQTKHKGDCNWQNKGREQVGFPWKRTPFTRQVIYKAEKEN